MLTLTKALVAVALVVTAHLLPDETGDDGPDAEDPTPIPTARCIPDDDNPYTGYRWKADQSICVPGLPTVKHWFLPAPVYSYGAAVWYAPGLMEATAAFRDLDLTDYVDGVSLMSPSDIGRTVWLRRPGEAWEGPYLVVDSAARGDIYPVIVHRGEVVEVGYETAKRWGMVGGGKVNNWKIYDVEVLKMDSLPYWIERGLVEPVHFPTWWEERVRFARGVFQDPIWPASIRPEHPDFPGWIWRHGHDPEDWVFINAYDDWAEFLFPGDEFYKSEIPDFCFCVVRWRCSCPGQPLSTIGGPIP